MTGNHNRKARPPATLRFSFARFSRTVRANTLRIPETDMAARTSTKSAPGGKPPGRAFALPWPLPALLAWSACWALFLVLHDLQLPVGWSAAVATALGVAAGFFARPSWRRLFIAAGFPLSLAASGLGASLPA